jgi:hypothetical protein
MAEWPRSGPYLRALAEWGFDSRLATRFAILGRNLFASPGARGRFLYCCGVVTIFLSFFSRNWQSDLSSETLWRSCGVGRGAGSAALTCVPLLLRYWFLFATIEMAEWPRSGPYLRALAEWGFDSRLATGFAILGRNLFASPGARGSFLYYCGAAIIFLSLFSRNWESDLSSETLWRSCGAGRGAGSAD